MADQAEPNQEANKFKPPERLELLDLSEEKLRELAQDYVDRKIFTDRNASSDVKLRRVFMPIAFGAFDNVPEEDMKNLGLIYEYISAAAPRSINGLPIFTSMRFLNRSDTDKLATYAKELESGKENDDGG